MPNLKKFAATVTLLLALSIIASTFLLVPVSATEDSWTTLEPMPTARCGFGVAVVDGKIYAIGGLNGSRYLDVVEEYDPSTDSWITKKPMPTGRFDFGVAVYQNKIYAIGGIMGERTPVHSGYTGVNEVYNPSTDTWETMEPMPTPRDALCANVVGDKIYLIGGSKYAVLPPGFCQGTGGLNEVYDPSNDSWTTKTPSPTSTSYHYASAVVNNKIYIMGGVPDYPFPTQIYTPENDSWSNGKTIPTSVTAPAAGATTGIMAPERIYILGGIIESPNIATNLTQVYDPETDLWTTGAPMPTPRWSLAVAVVNDELYAIGGKRTAETFSSVNEKYTPFGYIPEFPSWIILPLFLIVSLVVAIYRKRLPKNG